MTDLQEDKFSVSFAERIKEVAKACNKTLYDLANEIEVTEAGLYKMLSTGSMKVKTLKKIANVLDQPITVFFEGDKITQSIRGDYNYQMNASAVNEPQATYSRHLQDLIELNNILKAQLADKELIIELLTKQKT